MSDSEMHREYRKLFLAISIAMLLIGSVALLVPVLAEDAEVTFGLPAGADVPEWYRTVSGVLDSDTYALYPYQKKSLKVGFSKFGELINALPTERVGLEYGDRDAFAPPAGNSEPSAIPQRKWFSGWFINITYKHATASPSDRTVWASVSHASLDTTAYGNGWVYVDNQFNNVGGGKLTGTDIEKCEDPLDPGRFFTEDGLDIIPGGNVQGGRKTNGSAVTYPIKVLYDGPRRYVAQLETVISDVLDDIARPLVVEPLVSVVFTIDFNKVKKEVNVIKDVKLLFVKFQYGIIDITTNEKLCHCSKASWRHNDPYPGNYTVAFQGMYVQFSNRGEWDLGPVGPEPSFDSYAHFFTDGPGEDKYATAPLRNPTWEGLATAYDREYALIRTAPPNTNARWGIEPDVSGVETYDVAQIISSDLKYVGFAAFWPSLSDWSIDGVTDDLWWRSLTDSSIHREDCRVEPFTSPFVIGEWDFILTPTPFYDDDAMVEGDKQFRGVTVYGITDLNKGIKPLVGDEIDSKDVADGVPVGDGDDADRIPIAVNIIDREVYYQLSEVFRPWDLKKAVKSPRIILGVEEIGPPEETPICKAVKPERHLKKFITSGVTVVPLDATYAISYDHYSSDGWPFHSPAYDGDGKVGDDEAEVGEWYAYSTFAERVLDDGVLLVRGKDYNITLTPDGLNASIVFAGKRSGEIKILYSVDLPAYEWITVGAKAATVDSIGAAMVSEAFDSVKHISVQWGALDVEDPAHWTVPSLISEEARFDDREHLKDDWSWTIPIASSDIIGVGGPIANTVSEYFNEFAPVIYRGMPWFKGGTMKDLHPVSCWDIRPQVDNKGDDVVLGKYNVASAVEGPVGYAVITAYKDINGTTGFMVWGLTGNDTFWASQALYNTGGIHWKPGIPLYKELRVDSPTLGIGEHMGNGNGDLDTKDPIIRVPLEVVVTLLQHGLSMEEISLYLNAELIEDIMDTKTHWDVPLIEFLQLENCGVTALILEIDYTYEYNLWTADAHPMITIVEELGTKSEKPQHDP